MKINFRQGIIDYPDSSFLQIENNGALKNVTLNASNGPTIVAFAHKDTNYEFSESSTVENAWVNIPSTAWLYWDIDKNTGIRTFGYTTVEPVRGTTQPTPVVPDLHWFDTANATMKVFTNGRFVEKIRVFAAKFHNNKLLPLGCNKSKQFAGTQVGLNWKNSPTGRILFDDSGKPIVRSNGTFFTTETEVFSGATKVNAVRLETDIITARAAQSVAAFHVVKFSDFNTVVAANYNDTEQTILGIITDNVNFGDTVSVIVQGVITNPAWNWTTVGAELWVQANGELVDVDPNITNPIQYPLSKTPIARVISNKQIIFMQGLGKEGPRGPASDQTLASTTTLGNVYLTIDPTTTSMPIAVAKDDPDYLNSAIELDTLSNVNVIGASQGEVLTFMGSPPMWVPLQPTVSVTTLEDLTDVDLTSPSDGQVLVYNNATQSWVNDTITFPAVPSTLEDLTDVAFSTLSNGQVLSYNSSTQQWQNTTLSFPSVPTSLEDLNDVSLSNPTAGDFLIFDTSPGEWRNIDRISGDIGYYVVAPNVQNSSYTLTTSDAGGGIIRTNVFGSPYGSPTMFGSPIIGSPFGGQITWTLPQDTFPLGAVITLVRRFGAGKVILNTTGNTIIESQLDGKRSDQYRFILGHPAQVTLWQVEQNLWLLNGGIIETEEI